MFDRWPKSGKTVAVSKLLLNSLYFKSKPANELKSFVFSLTNDWGYSFFNKRLFILLLIDDIYGLCLLV